MNAEEIDKLFEALKNDDIDTVFKIADIKIDGDIEEFLENDKNVDNLLRSIMSKIEKGDYEHFLTHKGSEEYFPLLFARASREHIDEVIFDKEKRENLGLDTQEDIVGLLKYIENKEYVKEIIESKEKRENLGLDTQEPIVELLKSIIDDKEYIKEIIESKEKREEFGFNDKDSIIKLIGLTKDKEYIKEIIENKEKREQFGFDNRDSIKKLIDSTEDKEYIKEIINNKGIREELGITYDFEKKEANVDSKINLPTNMTIGMEIESEGENSWIIDRMTNIIGDGWNCKSDGSLQNGVEVVSPILTGDNQKTSDSIIDVCGELNAFGQSISDRCGGHVHIGADYLTSAKSWENLIELWGNSEQILYTISNKAGEVPRSGVPRYARPISSSVEEKLKSGQVQLNDEDDFKKFAKDAQSNDRYSGINFMNVGDSKNTIEFRLANGTIDAKTWIENINLFGGIVRVSEELSKAQEKQESERTPQEQKVLETFGRMKSEGISDKEKLENLLELVVPEENRDIYRERYEVNSKLIEERPDLKEGITKGVSKSNIEISKNKVGKTAFAGEDRITGQEFEQNQQIQKNLQRLRENEGMNIE